MGKLVTASQKLAFARRFSIDSLTDRAFEELPWFGDLLRQWSPAGDALHGGHHDPDALRLTIRDGYLSFYRQGQSVARVAIGAKGTLQARIHNKYVYSGGGGAKDYVVVTAAGVPDKSTGISRPYGGMAELRAWLANSDAYATKEKRFVDLVVARNANTIDLEMALPAYAENPEERSSPRMDLVSLEPVGERWRIVFWEAKLVDDGRIRCSSGRAPEVVAQLAQYTEWMRQPGHRESVASAYENACRLLVRLHALAKVLNPAIAALGEGIVAGAAGPLHVDDEPRLLIDNRAQDASFVKKGHLAKLRGSSCNIPLQVVMNTEEMVLRPAPMFLPGVPVAHVRERLSKAAGNELESGKLLHPQSSAALAVNCFGWFVPQPHLLPPFPGLEDAFPATVVDVEYQARFPWAGGRHPWLDAVALTQSHLIGIELKRFEPFRDQKTVSLSSAYDRPVWGDDMGPFESLRDDLRCGALRFRHLDATQLLKHAFGLVTDAKRSGKRPALVYLFAEPSELAGKPISDVAKELHRKEVASFSEAVAGAAVSFHAISYREWIASWDDKHSALAQHGAGVLAAFRV